MPDVNTLSWGWFLNALDGVEAVLPGTVTPPPRTGCLIGELVVWFGVVNVVFEFDGEFFVGFIVRESSIPGSPLTTGGGKRGWVSSVGGVSRWKTTDATRNPQLVVSGVEIGPGGRGMLLHSTYGCDEGLSNRRSFQS